MPKHSHKSITIRVEVDSSLYNEIVRRKSESDKPWATVTQDILIEGWSTIVLQGMTRSIIEENNSAPRTRYPEKYVFLKSNQKVYSQAYVQELESLLSAFLSCKSHPRKGEG